MKKIVLALTAVLALASCKNTPNQNHHSIRNVCIQDMITEDDMTWYTDTIYEMVGKVVVDSGAVLTIQPGTLIKAPDGQGSLSTALIIARGAQIMAEGTVDSPIVFTQFMILEII